jgi:SAM-dependent methyltransferase
MSEFGNYEANTLCQICNSPKQRILGRRGNREFMNAPETTIHLSTNIVQCRECSFIYCNPRILDAENLEKEHYNNPISYLASESTLVEQAFTDGFATLIKYKKAGKLLDVGAGKGEFLSFAKRQGFLVSGIEPSPLFCDYAASELGIQIFCGELIAFKKSIPLGSSYDVVTLFHVLEHVKDPAGILSEIASILSSESIVYIEVPNADATLLKIVDLFYRITGKGWSSRLSPVHPPFHSIGYTKKSLKLLLKNTGFEIVEIGTFTGKNRGHQVRGRFTGLSSILRSFVVKTIGLLPNKELIGTVVRLRN